MSVAGGPDIVTNGLVLYLDSGNKKCYPNPISDANTWYDLLTENVFINGVNNNFSWANDISQITISVFIEKTGPNTAYAYHPINKWNNGTGNASFVLYHFGTLGSGDGVFGWLVTSSNNGWFSIGNMYSRPLTINEKAHFCMQWDSIKGGQFWMNGQKISARTGSGILGVSGNSGINIYGPSSAYYDENCTKVHNVAFYNKELSDNEVLQNYNALKGRYGL